MMRCQAKAESFIAAAALVAFAGCAATNSADSSRGPVVNHIDDGAAQVTWSIAEAEQPPLLDGAAGVLTGAALAAFDARVGRYLAGTPALYEGALAIEEGERASVVATHGTLPSLYLDGVTFNRGVHALEVHAGGPRLLTKIWQDATWEDASDEFLPVSGLGSAWISVDLQAAAPALIGRCFDCMTILRDELPETIVLHTERVAPNRGGSVALHVDGELQRIVPEQITPEVLARVWYAQGDASAEVRAAEFREVAPGRWEREHVDRTYLRCKQGGSRMTDYRVMWRLEEGKPEASGILAIDVVGAAACEAFNYGGGS